MESSEYHDTGFVKTIYTNQKPFVKDYERQTRATREQIIQIDVNKERLANGTLYQCDNRGNFDPTDSGSFFPVQAGIISPANSEFTYTAGRCFKNITFNYAQTGDANDIGDVILTIDTEESSSFFCRDWFMFGTLAVQHVETFYLSGKHQITFKNLSPDAKAEI